MVILGNSNTPEKLHDSCKKFRLHDSLEEFYNSLKVTYNSSTVIYNSLKVIYSSSGEY